MDLLRALRGFATFRFCFVNQAGTEGCGTGASTALMSEGVSYQVLLHFFSTAAVPGVLRGTPSYYSRTL
jgi:hypothetical protein